MSGENENDSPEVQQPAFNVWEQERQEDREWELKHRALGIDWTERDIISRERNAAAMEKVAENQRRLFRTAQDAVNLITTFLAEFHAAYVERTQVLREGNEAMQASNAALEKAQEDMFRARHGLSSPAFGEEL